jgi:hypothetical protein
MTDEAFQSGAEQARADIAAGRLRLHYELHGDWGQDLQNTLRTRFGVEIIELTYFTSGQKRSFQAGYDAVVTAHIDGIFGAGAVSAAYKEVQARRKK